MERDVAIETLQANNLYQSFLQNLHDGHVTTSSGHVTSSSGHVTSANQIRRQNAHLKTVIAEMRSEMEQLALRTTNQITAEGAGDEVGVALSRGYVQYLEQEVVRLKAEGRHLRHALSSRTQREGEGGGQGGKGRRAGERPLEVMSSGVAVLQREKVWLQEKARELEEALRRAKEEVRMGRRGGREWG